MFCVSEQKLDVLWSGIFLVVACQIKNGFFFVAGGFRIVPFQSKRMGGFVARNVIKKSCSCDHNPHFYRPGILQCRVRWGVCRNCYRHFAWHGPSVLEFYNSRGIEVFGPNGWHFVWRGEARPCPVATGASILPGAVRPVLVRVTQAKRKGLVRFAFQNYCCCCWWWWG